MHPGLFLTFEGTEGVGKSTNLAFAADYLRARGIDVVTTREPGGTPLAEDIRALLLAPRAEAVHELTELLLIFAARAQHLHTFVLPHLAQGRWVISDRFTDATYAYQGGGRALSAAPVAALESLVQAGRQPDCTFLLDAPVDLGMQRAGRRGALDRFEQEALSFFERVRAVYLERAQAEPQRFRVIDASGALDDVQHALAQALEGLLSAR
ncbi:MAG: dTMP kinase [Gammaproteobacteria bacterium]|nr:dTMP kinase [Gammaproteobacteria bacterium]